MRTLHVALIVFLACSPGANAGELILPRKQLAQAITDLKLPEGDTKFQTWEMVEQIELTKTMTLLRLEYWRESDKFFDEWDEAILVIEEREDEVRAVFRVRRWHTERKYKDALIRLPGGSQTKEIELPADVSTEFQSWLKLRTTKKAEGEEADAGNAAE